MRANCLDCHGAGEVEFVMQGEPDVFPCVACGGTGKQMNELDLLELFEYDRMLTLDNLLK